MGGFRGRPSGPRPPFFYEMSVILPSSLRKKTNKKKKNRKYTRRKVNMGAKTLGGSRKLSRVMREDHFSKITFKGAGGGGISHILPC